MLPDVTPLYEACRAKKIVSVNYTKKDGTVVDHTGGLYEIRSSEGKCWIWDTTLQDTIRVLIINNINSLQVLDEDFIPTVWPVKIDGVEIP